MRLYKIKIEPVEFELKMWYWKHFNKKKWEAEQEKRLNDLGSVADALAKFGKALINICKVLGK